MKFEITVLALDNQNASLDLAVLDRHVGQGLDIESGRDLDDLRRDIGPRQASADPCRHVAESLRLQLIDENERSELGHDQLFSARRSSSAMMRRISSRRSSLRGPSGKVRPLPGTPSAGASASGPGCFSLARSRVAMEGSTALGQAIRVQ